MNTILIIAIIIGGTMAHVKGHKVKLPTFNVKENEVKNSFFKSFDSKPERITIGTVEVGGIYGDDREGRKRCNCLHESRRERDRSDK